MSDPTTDWIKQLSDGGPKQASIVIKANPQWVSTVTGRVEPYKNFPSKLKPALEAVADYMMKTAIPRTFKSEGPGWKQLSRRTQRERSALGFNSKHPILFRTGDLFRELTDRSHPKHVEIIVTGANARITLGGRSEKFVRNQLGNSTFHIPSRPMIPGTANLPLKTEDANRMREIMLQKIEEAMKQHA